MLPRCRWGGHPSKIYTFLQYFYYSIILELLLLLPFLGFLLNWNFFSLYRSVFLSFSSVLRLRKILRPNKEGLILSKNYNLLFFLLLLS